jgi:hypothetical protein
MLDLLGGARRSRTADLWNAIQGDGELSGGGKNEMARPKRGADDHANAMYFLKNLVCLPRI